MRYSSCIILFIFLSLSHFSAFGQDVQLIDSLQSVLKETENPSLKVVLLLKITREYRHHDIDNTIMYANQTYALATKNDDYTSMHKSLVYLIMSYNRLGDYTTAMDLAMQARDLADLHSMKKELAAANYWIGNTYRETSRFAESLDYINESLELYQELDHKQGIARSLSEMGVIYKKNNELEKALEYFLRSHKIKTVLNKDKPIIGELNNIGNIYYTTEEYEKALRYYLEALEINQGKRLTRECVYRMNIGNCYHGLKVYELAIEYYLEAYKIANEIEYNEIIVLTQLNLASTYLITDEPENSKTFALEAYNNAQKHNMLDETSLAASALHEYYLSVNDTANAYNYAVIEYQLKDSLNIGEIQQKIAKLEITSELEKRNQEILREKEKKENFYLYIGVILIIVFIAVFILFFSRQKSKDKLKKLAKEKMEIELNTRNKELTLNVMSLMRKNELLTGLSKELYEVKKTVKAEETKSVINKIARKIKHSSETEIWEEFELRFKEVYGEFYKTLLKKYPDLTPSEQKLCAFLRLNMSSKDISELTGHSLSSIDKARYRLRKKLHLQNSKTNLITFIAKI